MEKRGCLAGYDRCRTRGSNYRASRRPHRKFQAVGLTKFNLEPEDLAARHPHLVRVRLVGFDDAPSALPTTSSFKRRRVSWA